MGDYTQTQDVRAPAGQLFGYLSDIANLPRYFTAGIDQGITQTLQAIKRLVEAGPAPGPVA